MFCQFRTENDIFQHNKTLSSFQWFENQSSTTQISLKLFTSIFCLLITFFIEYNLQETNKSSKPSNYSYKINFSNIQVTYSGIWMNIASKNLVSNIHQPQFTNLNQWLLKKIFKAKLIFNKRPGHENTTLNVYQWNFESSLCWLWF